jgi:hypothetical protein
MRRKTCRQLRTMRRLPSFLPTPRRRCLVICGMQLKTVRVEQKEMSSWMSLPLPFQVLTRSQLNRTASW